MTIVASDESDQLESQGLRKLMPEEAQDHRIMICDFSSQLTLDFKDSKRWPFFVYIGKEFPSTVAVDSTGTLWYAAGHIDLSDIGFRLASRNT